MQAIAAPTGFFALTLIPVTAWHLSRSTAAGEIADAGISSLFFALLFALGLFLGRGSRTKHEQRSPSSQVGRGLLAASVAWSALWVGWSLLQYFPPGVAQQAIALAFPLNCAAMVLAGTVAGAWSPERQHESADSLRA